MSPILIDDGGSIRIRQLKDAVTMDGLIGAFTDKSDEKFATCIVAVHYHAQDGTETAINPVNLNSGDTVTITSSSLQAITVAFTANNPLTITILPPAPGMNPVVEAKQENSRRVYIIANAAPLQTVTVNAGAPTFNAANTPSIYTMVHFHDPKQTIRSRKR
jgi:hypothetical protein